MAVDMKYCRKCGKQVAVNAKFCMHCGFNFAGASQANTEERNTAGGKQLAKALRAAKDIGEFDYGDIDIQSIIGAGVGKVTSAVASGLPDSKAFNSAKELAASRGGIASRIFGILRDPKATIGTILLAAIWVVLPMFADMDLLPVKVLSAITYAKGGLTGDLPSQIGGIFGKSIVGASIIGLFHGGFGSISRGLTSFFKVNGGIGNLLKHVVGIIVGLLLYVIIGRIIIDPVYGAPIPSIAGAVLLLESMGKGKNSSFAKGMTVGVALVGLFELLGGLGGGLW